MQIAAVEANDDMTSIDSSAFDNRAASSSIASGRAPSMLVVTSGMTVAENVRRQNIAACVAVSCGSTAKG